LESHYVLSRKYPLGPGDYRPVATYQVLRNSSGSLAIFAAILGGSAQVYLENWPSHVTLQFRLQDINLMAKRGAYCIRVIAMARFADKLHVDTQKIDSVESAVLLFIIVGGLALCVLGAAISDIGRAFSVW
jgi:hypothetical protein